jgi:hypothetical protein
LAKTLEPRPQPLGPVFTAHLFPKLEAKLIELLRSFAPEDWDKQTLAPKWKVKDVAAHLLDTEIRKLIVARAPGKPDSSLNISPAELFALINTLNAEGIQHYRQLSNHELISRMEAAPWESAEYHQALDPFAPAMFPVSWAGEDESPNWFDTAPRIHRALAPSAADSPCGRQARNHDARTLLSRPGLFYARAAVHVPGCIGPVGRSGAI